MSIRILKGDCRELLKTLPDQSIHTCVTSPPYWGLRDYGHPGQMGMEATPEGYCANMVEVFREVKRTLRDDGTLWLNLGDSYAAGGKDRTEAQATEKSTLHTAAAFVLKQQSKIVSGLKPKDLVGIPWMVAFALRADGWYLRCDIIWSKPNPMPESVTDRPTKAHEYIFLMTKSQRYYYDAEAIKEPVAPSQVGRVREDVVGGTSHSERGQHSKGGVYKKAPTGWDTSTGEGGHGSFHKHGRGGKNAFRGQGSNRPEGSGRANRPGRDMSEIGGGGGTQRAAADSSKHPQSQNRKQDGHGPRHAGFNDRYARRELC